MSQKLKHHWVPQYHLRLFARGRRYIGIALRDGSRLVPQASVKGQCARHLLYQNEQVENWLARLEGRHAVVYKAVLDLGWHDGPPLSVIQKYCLRQALLLQRNRTPRRAALLASSMDRMALHAYQEYLSGLPSTDERRAMLVAIDGGRASLKNSESFSLLLALDNATQMVPVIADLSLLVLRNRTETPFLLGDSPCVLSNNYMHDVKGLGVCGLASLGLMVTMPIDSVTQVLLFDSITYHVNQPHGVCYDIVEEDDITLLNTLQVYGAGESIYFARPEAGDYVQGLISQHPSRVEDYQGGFEILGQADAGQAEAGGNEILHIFEPSLPVALDLSFIATEVRPPDANLNAVRYPQLVEKRVREMLPQNRNLGLRIEELVRWVESEVIVSP